LPQDYKGFDPSWQESTCLLISGTIFDILAQNHKGEQMAVKNLNEHIEASKLLARKAGLTQKQLHDLLRHLDYASNHMIGSVRNSATRAHTELWKHNFTPTVGHLNIFLRHEERVDQFRRNRIYEPLKEIQKILKERL
jgi:hypothetical protein